MMASDTQIEFEKQLEVLKLQYVLSFPNKARKLQQYWQQLNQDSLDCISAQTLSQYAHKLAGAAGCYGFTEISDQATVLESLVTLSVTDDHENWARTRAQVKHKVAELSTALRNPLAAHNLQGDT